jgi:quercetin dioxygenase-like cupin family protein
MTSKADIEGSRRATFIDQLARQGLAESQPAIYDRPIGLRLLYQDPHSGAEHYLVRYPAGLRGQVHRHSAAHTIVVIEGVLHADGRALPAGSYAHFPAETPMRHEPAPGQDCLFVILFDGPFDVHPVGDE